jgi:anti-sigma factor RsiW
VTCNPELVTGYVDGALDAAARAAVEAHLLECAACREQAESERALRLRLRALAGAEPRPALAAAVRRRLKRPPLSASRILLATAAGLALVFLWGRGSAPFVAWELAWDHGHCFSKRVLPAQVWTDDPGRVAAWFARQGTQLPAVPAAAGGLQLVGGRHCALVDRKVGHLYYVGGGRHLSVYAVPGSVRFARDFLDTPRGRVVRLLHVEGRTVGLVGERPEDVAAFERALTSTYARIASLAPPLAPASRGSASR